MRGFYGSWVFFGTEEFEARQLAFYREVQARFQAKVAAQGGSLPLRTEFVAVHNFNKRTAE